MHEVLDRASKVARSNVPVLLRGESGTGKEVLANLIHRLSPRSDKPMVIVNCAALPDTLLESELFGSTKGAFTGATADRVGFFAAADGGTLFLDEIGEVSASFQPKLLRVLETGEFHRIGDARHMMKVDVKVVAATNSNLENAIKSGTFRADLYYRLNVVPIVIPPLRERMEDLPGLLEHFIGRHKDQRRFSDEALDLMTEYHWPGNVREVANAVEHALVLGEGPLLRTVDLPAAIQESSRGVSFDPAAGRADDDTLEDIEIRCIVQAMEKTRHNRTRAARLLGVTRRTLGYRITKYGLEEELEQQRKALADPAARRVARVRSPMPGSVPSAGNS